MENRAQRPTGRDIEYERLTIDMMNAQVEIMNVAFKGCSIHALYINSTFESTVVATRCEFANSKCGAVGQGSSTSNLVLLIQFCFIVVFIWCC